MYKLQKTEMKEKKEGKKKKTVYLLILGILLVMIGIAGLEIWKIDRESSESEYAGTLEKYVTVNESATGNGNSSESGFSNPTGDGNFSSGSVANESAEENGDGESKSEYIDPSSDYMTSADGNNLAWYDRVYVDFDGLKDVNSDVIGWIYFENEDISYPVLQGVDNNEYLRTTFTRKRVTAGSIFMDSFGTPDFSDAHTLIYGHNMKNLSMFGKLKYYEQQEGYFDNHKYFQILTPVASYRYEIFCYATVVPDGEIYTIYRYGGDEFEGFIENVILGEASNTSSTKPGKNDKIITLSTCSKGNTRFVVSAVRVDEKKNSK